MRVIVEQKAGEDYPAQLKGNSRFYDKQMANIRAALYLKTEDSVELHEGKIISHLSDVIDFVEVKCPNKKCDLWLEVKRDDHGPENLLSGKCKCGQEVTVMMHTERVPYDDSGSETGG